MDLKNWKENSAIAGIRSKFENEKARGILRWIFALAVTFVFGALTAVAMFETVTMQENSMEPTIEVGDTFFINRAIYKLSSPKRGDLIVFRTSASADAALHIRRVIALPGETVRIKDGQIYIDGEIYQEDGSFPTITNPGLASDALTLQSNEYFVLGDNRNNSEDSRYTDIGMVSKRYIVGKLWFTWSPRKKLGFI